MNPEARTLDLSAKITSAAQTLAQAEAMLICAGAGMGVDSGLPDFRGPQGFWKAYPAIAKLGYSFQEMANPSWFEKDPGLAWAFYGHRLYLYRKTVPHAGFGALLALARQKEKSFFVFTSNVDGHFQKAGFPEERIVECHGSIHDLQCNGSCSDEIWPAHAQEVTINEDTFRAADPLPKCPSCGGLARPNVLMFDDWDWISHRTDAQRMRFADWLEEVTGAKLVIVELGAGTAVPTVRYTSEAVQQRTKGILIRINPQEEDVPAGQIGLPLGAAEGIGKIADEIKKINLP